MNCYFILSSGVQMSTQLNSNTWTLWIWGKTSVNCSIPLLLRCKGSCNMSGRGYCGFSHCKIELRLYCMNLACNCRLHVKAASVFLCKVHLWGSKDQTKVLVCCHRGQSVPLPGNHKLVWGYEEKAKIYILGSSKIFVSIHSEMNGVGEQLVEKRKSLVVMTYWFSRTNMKDKLYV